MTHLTNYFQSLRLVTAGVPSDSADYFYAKETKLPKVREFTSVPCWSIGTLWQILHQCDGTYEFDTELSTEELIEEMVKAIENEMA